MCSFPIFRSSFQPFSCQPGAVLTRGNVQIGSGEKIFHDEHIQIASPTRILIDHKNSTDQTMSRRMKSVFLAIGGTVCLPVILLAGFLTVGCSKLAVFDTFVPYDGASERTATNIVYGPNARNKLDVYQPVNRTAASPVLFFIYGGSWNSGNKNDYGFVGHAFAAAGYVTVIADYRLVPEVRFPDFVTDGAKAVAWISKNIAKYGGDPQRIFLAGHSAGAYNVMMLALDRSFLTAEGLPADIIKGAAGLSGPYDFLPLAVASTKAAFGQAYNLAKTQPVTHVTSRAPPIFIATGDADRLVRPKNTRALASRLRAVGARHQTRIYAGVDHAGTLLALSRPLRSDTPVLSDVIAYFSQIERSGS